ncbi:MAG TPA: hypothetical protein VF736_03120 [Pyrinomonadaceae bacterium]|jgi:hypothetical protein
MTTSKRLFVCLCLAAAAPFAACAGRTGQPANAGPSASPAARAGATPAGDTVAGVEKVKPAPGRGNVQGKVLFNGKPVEGIEVKLCEKFNQFFGGCSGKTFTAKSDADGDYVVRDVEPMTYEGLLVRVFDTDSFVFATTGLAGLSSAKYEVVPDRTLFARPSNIFKGDLKTVSPKAGSRVSAEGLELKWEPYPEAAYYKLSVYAEDTKVTSPYVGERVEATSFAADKPLQKGAYRWQVEAYNGSDQKLAESPHDVKFTVADGS